MVGRHKSYQVTEEPKVIIYCLGGGDRPRHYCSSASWSVIIIIQMYIIQYSSLFRHTETIVIIKASIASEAQNNYITCVSSQK